MGYAGGGILNGGQIGGRVYQNEPRRRRPAP